MSESQWLEIGFLTIGIILGFGLGKIPLKVQPQSEVSAPHIPAAPIPREKSRPTQAPIQYNFFGRSLTIGAWTIVESLGGGMHRLEIIDGLMYVDSRHYAANPGDIDRVRGLIVEIQSIKSAEEKRREQLRRGEESTEQSSAQARERKRIKANEVSRGFNAHTQTTSENKKRILQPRGGMAPKPIFNQVPKPTAPLDTPFQHVFFGRMLTIGQWRVVDGLDDAKHRLEIVQDQMYVDNKPYPANTGDVERIKNLIREAKI